MPNKIIGSFFSGERGKLSFNNDLDLSEIKRMYVIENSDLAVQRAWQGHQIEKRWFVAVKGKFLVKLVKIDGTIPSLFSFFAYLIYLVEPSFSLYDALKYVILSILS